TSGQHPVHTIDHGVGEFRFFAVAAARLAARFFAWAFASASRFALSRRPAKNSARAASTFWRTASIFGLIAIRT
ncbi:MAG: hypothetical protein ACREKB_15335, partial [Candidatus Rokuibacteriota bacterium]